MWFEPYISAALYAREASEASKSAIEQQRRQYEMARQEINNLAGIYPASMGLTGKPKQAKPHPSACENCGSSEYVPHHGRLICSYCRTAPDAPKVMHVDTTDAALNRFDLCYGHKALRPEMLVRITEDPLTRPCKGEV